MEALGKKSKNNDILKKFAAGIKNKGLLDTQHEEAVDALINTGDWSESVAAEPTFWLGMFQKLGLNLVWKTIQPDGSEEFVDCQAIAQPTITLQVRSLPPLPTLPKALIMLKCHPSLYFLPPSFLSTHTRTQDSHWSVLTFCLLHVPRMNSKMH